MHLFFSNKKIICNFLINLIFILISYPVFYYTYKFYNPNLGGKDFYFYYPLYKNLDITHTEAPFNMRLISSLIVYLFYNVGFYYDTTISFQNQHIDQRVFFNAIFVNWISIVITIKLIFQCIYKKTRELWFSFSISIIFLTGFGTIFFLFSPISDGVSILLITITYILYKKKNSLLYLLYILLLFQREFAFIIFGILAFVDFISSKDKFYIFQLILNILLFFTYIILRKTIFYTPLYSNQIQEDTFIISLLSIHIDTWAFIKQVFLSQNIYFIYLLILIINYKYKLSINKKHIYTLLLFIFTTFIISRIAVANNNMGRFLYMFVPILIIEMMVPEIIKLKEKLPDLFK